MAADSAATDLTSLDSSAQWPAAFDWNQSMAMQATLIRLRHGWPRSDLDLDLGILAPGQGIFGVSTVSSSQLAQF